MILKHFLSSRPRTKNYLKQTKLKIQLNFIENCKIMFRPLKRKKLHKSQENTH